MTAWRDLLTALRRGVRSRHLPARSRPTSLFEAGSVGSGERQVPSPDPNSRASEPRSRRQNLYPEAPVEANPSLRRRRAEPVAARRRTDSRAALRVALSSSGSLRTAVLLREILDPPVALREDRR